MLSALFQVQHSIQLEAVNKIKVDSRSGDLRHTAFPIKPPLRGGNGGAFREAPVPQMLIFCLLIGLHISLSLLKARGGSSLTKVCPLKWLLKVLPLAMV